MDGCFPWSLKPSTVSLPGFTRPKRPWPVPLAIRTTIFPRHLFLYVAISGSVFTTSILLGSYNYRIPCLSAFEIPGLFNSLGLFIDWVQWSMWFMNGTPMASDNWSLQRTCNGKVMAYLMDGRLCGRYRTLLVTNVPQIDDVVILVIHRAYQSSEAGHHPKRVFLLLILHVFLCFLVFWRSIQFNHITTFLSQSRHSKKGMS